MKAVVELDFSEALNAFMDGINDLQAEIRMLKAENKHLREELAAADSRECHQCEICGECGLEEANSEEQ